MVYALNGGNVTVELRESDGTVLESTTVNVPAGSSRIQLTLVFLLVTTMSWSERIYSGGLYRNNYSATYPYELDDVLSIVGATRALPTTIIFMIGKSSRKMAPVQVNKYLL